MRPQQLRSMVNGKTVKDAAVSGDQWQLEFPNNETLLIQNPDKLLFNEAS